MSPMNKWSFCTFEVGADLVDALHEEARDVNQCDQLEKKDSNLV